MLARLPLLVALLAISSPHASGQCEVMRLFASDNKPGVQYGWSVALEGATAVVGAYSENSTNSFSGATYVYDVSRGAPVELQKLIPTNVSYSAQSGWALALEGDWLAVANYNESPFGILQAGSVNLYHRSGPVAPFSLAQKITAGDPKGGAFFGYSLAMDGGRLAVGAEQDSTLGGFAGAAYIFELQGGTWTQTAKLLASDGDFGDGFGRTVALDADTVMVGANNKEGPAGLSSVGAVYVFERSVSGWSQTQKLTVGSPHEFMGTGTGLALLGSTAFISTRRDIPFNNTGAVHRFQRSGSTWLEEEVFSVSDPEGGLNFGSRLRFDGVRLVASATADDDLGGNSGSVYVFEQAGSTWVQTKKILLEGGKAADSFGIGLALWGHRLLVGALNTDEACPSMPTSCNSGSAILYELGSDSVQYCSCPSEGPCGNHDDFGGCLNSVGHGAVLSACGSGSVALDDLVLRCQWMPANQPALLFMGGTTASNPLGDGQLCVFPGPTGIHRFPAAFSTGQGSIQHGPGLVGLSQAFTPPGPIQPGEDRHFQVWFRDPAGPCGSVTNLSNAVRVTFKP